MNAVFFDLDGTLLDSRADLARAVNVTRQQLGLAELPQAHVLTFVGRGARALLEGAIPERAGHFDELWPQYRENYQAHMLDESTLYPGVTDTLAELAARGWRMGLNTNKPNFATHAILAHFGLQPYFGEAVIAGGDCAEMKPSPRPLEACAARLGGHRLSARDWMVGDHWTDLACGAAAGIQTAFCAYGFGQLNATPYTARLARFDDLLDLLGAPD